jgi:hypothetical protein
MANQQHYAVEGEGFVQLPVDSTGKRIRHVAVDVYDPVAETYTTVYMPTMTVVDPDTGSIQQVVYGEAKVLDRDVLQSLGEMTTLLEDIRNLLMEIA